MSFLKEWWRRLRTVGRVDEIEGRLDEEVRFHLEKQVEKNLRAGMDPDEARRAAYVRFGGVEPLKERTRDEYRPALFQDFGRDLRTSARALGRVPGFAAATILTIGIGTGAATAVFSVVEHVLLRPLPYPDSDRIVRLFQLSDTGSRSHASRPNFDDWQAQTRGFEAMATWSPWGPMPVLGGREAHLASTTQVSRDFFAVMGLHPVVGREFSETEQQVNGPPAAIVSHRYWRLRMGGEPIGGQVVGIGNTVYPVIGVMPEGFDYPDGTAIWLASGVNRPNTSRTAHNHRVAARLQEGVPLEAAQADISAVSRALKAQYGDDTWMSDAEVVPLLDQLTATSKPVLQMLFGASILLLVVACTNVSSLLLARAATRRHELAVLLAVGASRYRLVRQLLAETLVLCAGGGIVGVLVAVWAVPTLVAMGPETAHRLDQVQVDWLALAFALGITAIAAFVLALITSLGTRRIRLASVLSESPRTGTAGRLGIVTRQVLVVAQVALTLVLLVGTGLLGRSLVMLLSVDPGYRVDDALVLDLTVTTSGAYDPVRRVTLLDELLARIEALPGVERTGLTSGFPLGGGSYQNGRFLEMTSVDEIQSEADVAELGALAQERTGDANFRVVSPDYFSTMGIPLLRGRVHEPGDSLDAPHVAVISQSLAEARWPGRDPIGRFVQFGNMDGDPTGFRIVGVVGDVRELTFEAPPEPTFYVSYRQRPNPIWRVNLIVRGPEPAAIESSVRRVVREVNPELPAEFRTVEGAFEAAFTGRRFSLLLVSAFGIAALLLATVGLYSLIAYVVAQRQREMGIRMALGATPARLVTSIVIKGAVLAVAGGAAGLGLAVMLTGVLQGMLFGVEPLDPAVLGVVAGVTVLPAIGASYLPARRAARVSPVSSLRGE